MKVFTCINVHVTTRDYINNFALTLGKPKLHVLIGRAITFCALPENREAFVKHLTSPTEII